MVLDIFRKPATGFLASLVIVAVLLIPNAGAAQSRAQKSIITQLLWQSLLRCYVAPSERISGNDEVVLRVELNTNGDISNLPDLISPATLSTGERGLLREATVAIIDCTPIISGGGEKSIYGRFDMVINRDGLSLSNVDAYVGKSDALPTLDSLEIAEQDSVLVEITKPEETASFEEPIDVAPALGTVIGEPPTLASEKELELTSSDRREIQRRLVLLDYHTRGIDGVFGNGSRAAIGEWQKDNDQPISGYLDLNQLVFLREMSQGKYETWQARPKRYTDSKGCLREPNGKIVQGRSFKCDLSAAGQSLGISK
ncbi:MAG: peptidoglycan-binding domain-containing protein [Paracoccaceae bacterium]